jgi:hypothetical protein
MADAFACYGPQGIDGCGYESPLEAMKPGDRPRRAASNGSGFMRDEALLSVVLVTDEADCSSDSGARGHLHQRMTTFQNDETIRGGPAATCWRAGTACSGAGPDFTECHARGLQPPTARRA